jgi:hypothetical protein
MPASAERPIDWLDGFYHGSDHERWVTADQGSRFAKQIAGDHNPLHDPDSSRFCVPGDLLFALILRRYGLARRFALSFRGMLRAGTRLRFPSQPSERFMLADENDRDTVEVCHEQPLADDLAGRLALIEAYVACSGETFPDRLGPLLAEAGVMFNPQRPFLVYDGMNLAMDRAPGAGLEVRPVDASLTVNGKRADVQFDYQLIDADGTPGTASKRMVVSGLRAYDAEAMAAVIAAYQARRAQ